MLNKTLYTNNMVFQYNYPIRLVGSYLPNESVKVKINNEHRVFIDTVYFADSEGELDTFIPIFDNEKKSFQITVTSGHSVQILTNCQLGHVFLAMGQSNMRLPLRLLDQQEEIISTIDKNANISFLLIDDAYVTSGVVERPLKTDKIFKINRERFMIKDTKSVLDFSGILVVYALEHYKKHQSPIQVIDVSVPGCSLPGFLSMETILNDKQIYQFLKDTAVLPITDNHYTMPSGIFNEKIYPLRYLKLQGVFWLQGEHHVGGDESANFYKSGLKALIKSYRNLYNQQDLRWINIHIQNHFYAQDKQGISISLINEAMTKVSSELNEVYTIPVHDQFPNWQNEYMDNESNPIHPTNKRYIGKRLFYSFNYPKDIIEVKEVIFNEDHVLVILNQKPTFNEKHVFGFAIGNTGRPLTYAEAEFIKSNTIKVFAKDVFNPNVLTYGFFLYNMRCQLYGKHHIPLKPFRIGQYNEHNMYYQPYGFEDLSSNKIEHLSLSTMFNQVNDGLLIKPGRFIYNQATQVKMKDKQMTIFGIGAFSLSINLTQNNHKSMFKHYRYLEITIENSDVAINGIVLLTTQQTYYQLYLKEVIGQTYRFDMHTIYALELNEVEPYEDILGCIKELEITGIFNRQSSVVIKHIRMYQSEVEHV